MLKVGLTGGIACGKSYVLREFKRLGACVVEADEIAHQVILPGQPAYAGVVEAFGKGILAPDETIDRKKLGARVFANPALLKRLNALVHPAVLEEEARRIAACEQRPVPGPPMVVVDAALMVEAGTYRRYDFIVVVHCRPAIQLQRLMKRDGLSEEEALQRIRSQMPLAEKVKHADFLIENSGRLSEAKAQVRETFRKLLEMAEGEATDKLPGDEVT